MRCEYVDVIDVTVLDQFLNDRGFFDPSRWLRKQKERDYVFKEKKIKKPNVYPMVARWAKRHFPESLYKTYYVRIPDSILKQNDFIVNRIYSVDEVGRETFQQLRCELYNVNDFLCSFSGSISGVLGRSGDSLPEYIKYVEDSSPFDNIIPTFLFLIPCNPSNTAADNHIHDLSEFLERATLSQRVKHIDRVDREGLQASNDLVSLVEDSM